MQQQVLRKEKIFLKKIDYCMVQNFEGKVLMNLMNFYQFVKIFPSKFSFDNLLPFACQITFWCRTLSQYTHTGKIFPTQIYIAKWKHFNYVTL